MDKSITTVEDRDFNTPFSLVESQMGKSNPARWRAKKHRIYIYLWLQQRTCFFSSIRGIYAKINRVLNPKESLNKCTEGSTQTTAYDKTNQKL